ncbi:MAG: glycosyltransferase [Chloroflexi bacterium]|nr:glycosyltransferase [Chloroflexota bacterium]
MKLSIVIPAFNEAKCIAVCVQSVFSALRANARPDLASEVIVVDNNSTDATAELARREGAEVVFEPVNQISRARNAGGKVAGGDWLLFIDADSWLSAATLADMLRVIENGPCAGGGCVVAMDDAPFLGRHAVRSWNWLSRACQWAAGSFVFCRAEAFRDLGGFSQELYAAEEIEFSRNLKRWARAKGLKVVILTAHPHVSSGRKFYLYSKKELLRHTFRSLVNGTSTLRKRNLLDYFYDGRR